MSAHCLEKIHQGTIYMQLVNTVAKDLSMSRSVQIVEKTHYDNQ